jgi:hypothetical protein
MIIHIYAKVSMNANSFDAIILRNFFSFSCFVSDHCFGARMAAIFTVASFKVSWRTSCAYVSNQDKSSAY